MQNLGVRPRFLICMFFSQALMWEQLFEGGLMGKTAGLKAGLKLEELVSEELERLNVCHRRTAHRGDEDVREQIDLVVEPPQFSGLPQLEIQLTLKRGMLRKMRTFALAALSNPNRGVRVYLEIWASKWNKVRDIARRVAHAIRDITHFRRFEEHKLLGVRLKAGRSVRGQRIERFSILHTVGDWVWDKLEERRLIAIEKARQRAKERLEEQRRWQEHCASQHAPQAPRDLSNQQRRFRPPHQPRMFVPIRQPR
jgi:hypothetical protein